MGFDNSDIVKQLFSDIIFCQFRKTKYICIRNGKIKEIRLEYTVQVFIDNTFAKLYSASDSKKIWLDINRFLNYTGKVLFGLEYSYTQSCIEQVQIPSCIILQWAFGGVLEYHLKKNA
ncbi:hypothetical protein GLOIN_2v1840190 [Rhizophagus clarus]|uniref:Uncharacterized protein n=1 Tax=Rhizophagus clarus TaxID=94130 RepID=A0A8H3LS05_9GLOM|nr:hypothetical protein GLOIN_2v1840190 [Rhizophagus clarus]